MPKNVNTYYMEANSHFGSISTLARDFWYLTLWTDRQVSPARLSPIQSLTIPIVFELIYYTNGHPRA